MFIDQITNAGALPSLRATMSFAGQRQKLIAHNIANAETPNFRPLDVSPAHFQTVLGEAIDRRRGRSGGSFGALQLESSRELRVGDRGELMIQPQTTSGNILFHDRNDRDLERMMQDLTENYGVYRLASDLLRSHTLRLQSALGERVG
ncbi:MAG: hypothetical protein EA378_09925 [Phycisphaerales bacterium]|nr:MAG: hypothetical protein EA378_09925 [Phycisphaerales bacterium]